MIIESIRDYFIGCELLDEFSKINVDYLGVNAVEYTIDSVPSNTLIMKYVDGGKLKQYLFVFGSREYYGSDVLQNIENSGFYESFADWIELQDENNNYPVLGVNKEVVKLEVTTSGYLYSGSQDVARYQIQLRLTYYEN